MQGSKRTTPISMLSLIIAFGCSAPEQSGDAADTVYTNGRIYTVNEDQPWAEAVAIVHVFLAGIGEERYQQWLNVRSAVEAGIPFGFGTDWPASLEPVLNGFSRKFTRRESTGQSSAAESFSIATTKQRG